MIRAGRALLLLLPGLATSALAADDVRVRVDVDRRSVHVGETVEAVVRVELDQDLLTNRLVPLFRRPLDWSMKLDVPWLGDSPLAVMSSVTEPVRGTTLAVEDDVRRLSEVQTAPGWTARELRARFRTRAPGELSLSPTTLRFAVTSRFDVDVFGERVPVDRTPRSVDAETVTIEVLPLPERGRPDDFSGAVGRFEVAASWIGDPESRTAEVTITGAGRLADADPPLWPDGATAPRGVLDDRGEPVRTLRYELSPSAHEFPALTWSVFETGDSPRYHTLRTSALPVPGAVEPAPPPRVPEEPPVWPWALAGVGVAVIAGGILLLRRRDDDVSLERRRLETLRTEFHSTAAGERGPAFVRFVAHVYGWEPAAVVTPDLARRLEVQGLDTEIAREVAGAVERITQAGYGGQALGTEEFARLDVLADRLVD